MALLLGLLWALYIVRTFARRLRGMLNLARRMADGNYDTQIVDTEQDEASTGRFQRNTNSPKSLSSVSSNLPSRWAIAIAALSVSAGALSAT